MAGRARRWSWASVLTIAMLGVGLRVGAVPAEDCPDVTSASARAAVEQAVGWFAATQEGDGRFLYFSHEDGRDLGGYNAVRHAGVLMSLEQAAVAGVDAARPVADRGLEWALDHLRPAGGGQALSDVDGRIATGASALLTRALLYRGEYRDDVDPRLLEDLGTFLAGQVDEDGAVLSTWDPVAREPTGAPNAYFTGEAFWALLGLDGFDDAKARIGAYLPGRDQAEDVFPPIADHWSTYSYAAIGLDDLTPAQEAHAERLAGLFGMQVRGESTRWAGGLQRVLRGGPAMASGLGTLGEGTGNLLELYGDRAPSGVEERLRCVAGMLVARQADDGAWYTQEVTRMDDQQHAMSALLFSGAVLGRAPADAVGGGEAAHPFVWLLALAVAMAALVAQTRPGRSLRFGVGAAVLIVLSGPVLDWLEVTPASARIAAGVGVALGAVAALIAPRADVTRGAVAVAAATVALGVGADDGARAVLALLIGAAVAGAVPGRATRPTLVRAAAAVLVVLAVDLVIDGILGV